MPDLFNTPDGDRASATRDFINAADRVGKPKHKRAASPRAKTRRIRAELKYGGALTTALAAAFADTSGKQTKDQRASSVIPDIIAAMEAHPGVKPGKLWPLLKELDPQNDGAHFRRAVNRMLHEEATRNPVVALSMQPRTPRLANAGAADARIGKPAAAPTDGAGKPSTNQAKDEGPSSLEAELRGLRAPGF